LIVSRRSKGSMKASRAFFVEPGSTPSNLTFALFMKEWANRQGVK
jgi:hypothetical protein